MKLHVAAATLCCALTLHAQAPLRLSGSTTVKGALEPKQAALETAVGRSIQFSGTGTSAGLLSLVSGVADVAMLSMTLEDAARMVNERSPGKVNPAEFRAVRIGDARTVFIVNPHNPVRMLTAEQLGSILTGKITNWKDVGGADAPIVVVSLGTGGSLLEHLLQGQPITASAHTVPNATQIPVWVARERNAIGIISATHARGQTSVVQTDAQIAAPLYLVTKGEPDGALRKLEETARTLLATVN